MIKQAKANLIAVKTFEKQVSSMRNYSPKLNSGISYLEELCRQLMDSAKILRDQIPSIQVAIRTLIEKIENIKMTIDQLRAQLEQLETQLESLEFKKACTPPTIKIIDENGETHEDSNPEYEAICEEIAAVEQEISACKEQLCFHELRLQKAYTVHSQLNAHINLLNGTIYSLEEKQNICRSLKSELEVLKSSNLSSGASASEALKKLEKVIEKYLNIKMKYENFDIFGNSTPGESNLHMDENASKMSEEEETSTEDYQDSESDYPDEEIEQHQIVFDEDGHISQYDGKTFGGKYNSYDIRLKRTPVDDNPVIGQYEGIRGESRFIPSRRTAQGISVINILNNYGLDGIEYRNAEPDFEPCSEAVVTIKAMSENRENYTDISGMTVAGNFTQADIDLARLWNNETRNGRKDWSPREVLEYRYAHQLTWHEKCDTKTMVLVHRDINSFFKHSGGCSECRIRDMGTVSGGEFDE